MNAKKGLGWFLVVFAVGCSAFNMAVLIPNTHPFEGWWLLMPIVYAAMTLYFAQRFLMLVLEEK
jgi:hypothetical protein